MSVQSYVLCQAASRRCALVDIRTLRANIDTYRFHQMDEARRLAVEEEALKSHKAFKGLIRRLRAL